MGNSIDEIAAFCLEGNTFGALLLTGEWGSGKTYLLEHDLPDRLGERAVLIRVSLFGETSVEAVRTKIKKAYVSRLLEYVNTRADAAERLKDSANSWICKTGELSAVEKIFVMNPDEYVCLEPEIGERRVILIFDDLERCHLAQAEILGCINEYTENLHLKTIIVANEEKIQRNKSKNQEDGKKDFLAYSEIKEKIIACTVKLKADYGTIIENIIGGYQTDTAGYHDFLRECTEPLVDLVQDCEIRNIRSLRCAIRDFEKIYVLGVQEEIGQEEIRKYFESFVLFVMLAKGGQVSKSNLFGYGLNRLAQKYPAHYQERYMPNCMKDWVLEGNWPGEEVVEIIRKNAKLQQKTTMPEYRLRSMQLMEMDDITVAEGWKAYLDIAYSGGLNLDEYVIFIRNCIQAREYGYSWPIDPDPMQLEIGVDRAFARICESEQGQKFLRERLDEASWKRCDEEERRIYGKIVSFHDSKAYLYGINRNRLLTALRERSEQELIKCRNYDFRSFDMELAEAVIGGYRALDSNQDRMVYIESILRILRSTQTGRTASGSTAQVYGSDPVKTEAAIRYLRDTIREIREEENAKPLKQITTDHFLREIEGVLQ